MENEKNELQKLHRDCADLERQLKEWDKQHMGTSGPPQKITTPVENGERKRLASEIERLKKKATELQFKK